MSHTFSHFSSSKTLPRSIFVFGHCQALGRSNKRPIEKETPTKSLDLKLIPSHSQESASNVWRRCPPVSRAVESRPVTAEWSVCGLEGRRSHPVGAWSGRVSTAADRRRCASLPWRRRRQRWGTTIFRPSSEWSQADCMEDRAGTGCYPWRKEVRCP